MLRPDDDYAPPLDRALVSLLQGQYGPRRVVGVPAHEVAADLHDLPPVDVDRALDALIADGYVAPVKHTMGYLLTAKGLHHAAGLLTERPTEPTPTAPVEATGYNVIAGRAAA